MKKLLTMVLSGALFFSLMGCSSDDTAESTSTDTSSEVSSEDTADDTANEDLQIGVIQLVEHPALQQIEDGIVDTLTANGYSEDNITIQNAQNDMSNINTIVNDMVADKYDLIIPITTPVAQSTVNSTQDIPIVFSGVTDPIDAGLVSTLDGSGTNVTGTKENIDVEAIFELADELTPGIESYGFIYNLGESNAVVVVDEAKEYLDAHGMTYQDATISSTSELQQATTSLVGDVDAFFIPNDNTVASGMPLVSEIAIENGIPCYATADTLVEDGALATVGINYYDLGTLTGDMALEVLDGTNPGDMPVEYVTDYERIINEDTAAALNIDVE